MRDIRLTAIGTVRNGRESVEDSGWGAVLSTIELEPEFAAGVLGLEAFSHAIVIFYMHEDSDAESTTLVRRPRGRRDMPEIGVFAQRGRMRPNPIGVTAVEIVGVERGRVAVRGLDAIEGTPVLDLKPYFPIFDRRDAHVPDWVGRLMEGYF